MLVNPNFQGTDSIINDMQGAARALRLELKLLNASSDHEFDTAIASATELRAGALVVAPTHSSSADRSACGARNLSISGVRRSWFEMVVFSRLHCPPKNGQGVRPSWQNGLRFRNSLIGGLHMSTMIREQDGFITIYDHYSRRLMMIELYGLQKKISRETWLDAASAKEAFLCWRVHVGRIRGLTLVLTQECIEGYVEAR